MFSLQGSWLKITCWLLLLGGKIQCKSDVCWLYRLHSNFTQWGEEWWLTVGFKLVPSFCTAGNSVNALLRMAELEASACGEIGLPDAL